jgi:UDPglucose 6-dehydrogenase
MNIGIIGLGKLGLPSVLAMEKHTTHSYFGYDRSDSVVQEIKSKSIKYWESGVDDLLSHSQLKLVDSIDELVKNCELIFVAVQTPHDKDYEGNIPAPEIKKDFNYKYLILAIQEVASSLSQNRNPLIVIISTVLPGTIRREIIPILRESRSDFRLAYNPYFIAMGTTIEDFLNPEFILIGSESIENCEELRSFYSFLSAPILSMSIESAELTKVTYNTFIGMKIVFANTIAEITGKIGGNPDDVTAALSIANKRLMSGAYFSAGLGDGGGCHPRDQIAMSWLAENLKLSNNIFNFLAKARDSHAERIADEILELADRNKLPICMLGVAYKPNSPLETGSPAKLVGYYLEKSEHKILQFDPWVRPDSKLPNSPHLFVLGVRHELFKNIELPKNSVVFDPWGFYEPSHFATKLIQFGRGQVNHRQF